MEHWWAFHACLQLVSTAKQIFCIFMLGYTTRKWSFPGLWRQWRHRRSPCSAGDVDTAKPWWSGTVAQHFPTSWAPSPPLKQAGPSHHVWMLYLGRTWEHRGFLSRIRTVKVGILLLTWVQPCRLVRCYSDLCQNKSLFALQTSLGGLSASVLSLYCRHLFFVLVISSFALLKWFLKHPRRGDGPVNALLCSGARP